MHRLDFKPLVDVSVRRKMPIIVAHRGARREAPENTLQAIKRALDQGAGGIEFDVLLTKDKVPIVTHNNDLSVLTHHNGYAHTTPFAIVKSLDVGSHFSASTAGITMPTLVEALEAIQPYNVTTIVEIKAQPGLTTSAANLIGGIVADFKMEGRISISSSNLWIIHELGRRHPKIARSIIVKRRPLSFFRWGIFARLEGVRQVHSRFAALSPWMVERLHERGTEVYAWTANEPDDFDLCLALEVDGIITDDVTFARQYIDGIFSKGR